MTATNAEASTWRVEQKGSFELPMTAETAFPLFSPEGERLWVPQWNPTPIFPVDDVVRWQTNAVWSIVRDGEPLTWWTVEVDHKNRNASYVHFSTGRAVRVNVHVEPIRPSACRVQVEYIITATSPEGERHVSQACNMEARMTQWKNLIEAALPTGEVPPIRH
jgi:hypothetical protein